MEIRDDFGSQFGMEIIRFGRKRMRESQNFFNSLTRSNHRGILYKLGQAKIKNNNRKYPPFNAKETF
jgi:hypothetical protein